MTRPIGRLCIAVLALIASYAASANALQLEWQAPAECPNADLVLREVLRLAGTTEGNSLIARAIVSQSADQRWRVAIELSGSATGHRTLTADNCAQLARASALIIALAANPDAALDLPREGSDIANVPTTKDEPRNESATASTAELDKDKTAAAPPSAAKALVESPPVPTAPAKSLGKGVEDPEVPKVVVPRRHRNRALDLFANTGFEWGSLPTTVGWLGLGARLGLAGLPVSTSLAARATQGTSATFIGYGVGAEFRQFAAQWKLCVDPASGPWFFATCAGMQLALLRATGTVEGQEFDPALGPGVRASKFIRYRWIPAPLLALGMGYEFLPGTSLEIGADLMVPMTHWTFVVENLSDLYRPDDRQYLLYIGLGYRLR